MPFVLIADTNGRQWAPRAYPPDQVPQDARRIAADTLGETLIVGLWSFVDDRPDSPTADVVGWWTPIAKAAAARAEVRAGRAPSP